jgi:hypothetical protein
MTLYDTAKLDNATGVYEVYKETNVLSDGLLAHALLFLIALILLMVFRGRVEFKDLMLGVSFMVAFLAVLLFALELVTLSIFYFPLIMLIAAIIIRIWGA